MNVFSHGQSRVSIIQLDIMKSFTQNSSALDMKKSLDLYELSVTDSAQRIG